MNKNYSVERYTLPARHLRRQPPDWLRGIPPLVNTEFSAETGRVNGISASGAADGLVKAVANDRVDVPVSETKKIHPLLEQLFFGTNA